MDFKKAWLGWLGQRPTDPSAGQITDHSSFLMQRTVMCHVYMLIIIENVLFSYYRYEQKKFLRSHLYCLVPLDLCTDFPYFPEIRLFPSFDLIHHEDRCSQRPSLLRIVSKSSALEVHLLVRSLRQVMGPGHRKKNFSTRFCSDFDFFSKLFCQNLFSAYVLDFS